MGVSSTSVSSRLGACRMDSGTACVQWLAGRLAKGARLAVLPSYQPRRTDAGGCVRDDSGVITDSEMCRWRRASAGGWSARRRLHRATCFMTARESATVPLCSRLCRRDVASDWKNDVMRVVKRPFTCE